MAFPQMMRGESEQTREYLREVACDDYFDAIEINWIKDPQQRKKAAEVLMKLVDGEHVETEYLIDHVKISGNGQ